MTPDFGAMAERQYFLEGAFRRLHVRLRTHAESIAFFGGGPREGRTVTASFDQLQVGVVFVRSRIDTRTLISCSPLKLRQWQNLIAYLAPHKTLRAIYFRHEHDDCGPSMPDIPFALALHKAKPQEFNKLRNNDVQGCALNEHMPLS